MPDPVSGPSPLSPADGRSYSLAELPIDTALYEQVEESVAVYWTDATCLYLNPVTERIFGKRRTEIVGRVLWDVFPEAVGNLFYKKFQQVAQTGERAEFDHFYEPWGQWFANRMYVSGRCVYVFAREITEEKRAAEALKLHTRILESMAEGVYLSSGDGVILYVNAAEARMFGRAPEELIGKPLQILHPPEENAHIEREVLPRLQAGGGWEGELLNVRKDGTSFVTRARVTALEIAGRSHWVCVQEDVTEGKRAEERTSRLRAVTAALSQAVTPREVATLAVSQGVTALTAVGGGIWLVSEEDGGVELAACHGLPPEAVESFRRLPLQAPLRLPFLQVIRSREPVWAESGEQLRGDFAEIEALVGHRTPGYGLACLPLLVEQRCIGSIAFTFEAGHPLREDERVLLLVLARQCALALERARLYEEMQRAQQRSAFLARASEVLASSLDYETTLNTLTRLAVPTLADWCVVDMLGADGRPRRLSVAHQDPRKVELALEYGRRYPIDLNASGGVGRVLRTGEPELIPELQEEMLARSLPDPEQRRAIRELGIKSYISVPLENRGKVLGALSLVYADSDRRYTRSDLDLALDLARRAAIAADNALLFREAQQAIQVRDDFLSVASHELKTPLTPLTLKLQVLAQATAAQPESPYVARVRACLEISQKQVKKLADLVNDLLDVSRIIAGRMKLESEEVDFTTVVREVAASHETHAERVGSKLLLDLQPVRGQWDRLRIEQVVTNLVDNAIRYGAGKPIHVHLRSDGGTALLEVRDEGIGIAPEDLSRIFGRFERAVAGRNYGGLGLGLYITRTVVEALGGEIRVESERGRGSTFSVRLPLQMPPQRPPEAEPLRSAP